MKIVLTFEKDKIVEAGCFKGMADTNKYMVEIKFVIKEVSIYITEIS